MRPALRPTRAHRMLLLTLLLPALLAGCVSGPSERPPVLENDEPVQDDSTPDDEQVPLPPLGQPQGSTIDWAPCEGHVQNRFSDYDVSDSLELSCTMISSALDAPGMTGSGTIRLSLLKAGRGDIPLVVVNDVDEQPGSVYVAQLAEHLPDEMLDKFSLIGVDRRYTGHSQPNNCMEPRSREQMLGFDPASEDLKPLLDIVSSAGQPCTIELGNEQGALDSWRTAGDLEQIREQLGMSKLHAIGRGDGAAVINLYAQRYPGSVGRLMLDGVPDPTSNAVTRLEGVAEGAEQALAAFAEECERQDCSLEDPAPAAVDDLLDELRAEPLPTPQGASMGPGLALYAIWSGLGDRQRWSDLARGIAEARAGDADTLAEFVEPMLHHTSDGPPRLDTGWATQCNDTPTRLNPEEINEISADWREQHPTFGGLIAQQLVWCAAWPAAQEQHGEGVTDGVPPILVASTADDPMTPERGTKRAALQMPTSVSLAWQGAGHGALGQSTCVTEQVHAFFADGEIPQDGTPCPA